MDRRNFFKRWGAVAVVPFVPFKWKRTTEEVAKEIKVDKSTRKVKRDKYADACTAYSISIDGVDCTNVCQSLEVSQDVQPIDITDYLDLEKGIDPIRQFAPGLRQSVVKARFIMTHDDFWRRLDPSNGAFHHVEIISRAAGVMYSCQAFVQHKSERAIVSEVVTLDLEFASSDLVATVTTRRA